MRRVAVPLLSLLLVALAAPAALATSHAPPPGAETLGSTFTVAYWVGERDAVRENGTAPGETGALWFGARDPYATNFNRTEGVTARYVLVNLTSTSLNFTNASVRLALPTAFVNGTEWTFGSTTFTAPATAGNATFTYDVGYFEETPNGTTLVAGINNEGAVTVAAVAPTPPEAPTDIPTSWLVGGGAVVLIGGGAALYAMKQRRDRRVMNEAPRRSQVMRELELEKELEKVEEKEPERAAEIKQEIRAQEVVREKRRELQILEAKRADVLKTMDLLKKRHEAGGLTKHQYDNMVKKKQTDLEKIEADIAQMEAEDAAGGAAA